MGKPRRSSAPSATAPKIERKIIEKIRRNRMKSLCSNLTSLLPNHTSKVERLALPDQIDEAVEHIKSMTKKLEILREKREMLVQGKRSSDSCVTSNENRGTDHKRSSPPVVEVHNMGPNLDVVSAKGVQDYSTFHHIIRLVHQHGVEIASASFARNGNSIIQVLQDKIGQSKLGIEGATMSRQVKELVHGACSRSKVVESELKLWDYEIESDIWGFGSPQILGAGTNFGYYESSKTWENFIYN